MVELERDIVDAPLPKWKRLFGFGKHTERSTALPERSIAEQWEDLQQSKSRFNRGRKTLQRKNASSASLRHMESMYIHDEASSSFTTLKRARRTGLLEQAGSPAPRRYFRRGSSLRDQLGEGTARNPIVLDREIDGYRRSSAMEEEDPFHGGDDDDDEVIGHARSSSAAVTTMPSSSRAYEPPDQLVYNTATPLTEKYGLKINQDYLISRKPLQGSAQQHPNARTILGNLPATLVSSNVAGQDTARDSSTSGTFRYDLQTFAKSRGISFDAALGGVLAGSDLKLNKNPFGGRPARLVDGPRHKCLVIENQAPGKPSPMEAISFYDPEAFARADDASTGSPREVPQASSLVNGGASKMGKGKAQRHPTRRFHGPGCAMCNAEQEHDVEVICLSDNEEESSQGSSPKAGPSKKACIDSRDTWQHAETGTLKVAVNPQDSVLDGLEPHGSDQCLAETLESEEEEARKVREEADYSIAMALQQQEWEEEERQAAIRASQRDCMVCGDALDPLSFPANSVTHSCDHPSRTCSDCLRQWMKSEFDTKGCDGIKCPECPKTLEYDDVQRAACAETFEAYDRMATRNALSSLREFAWCLSATCGSGQLNDENDDYMECVSCGYRQCLQHKVPWHAGETCEQYNYRASGQKARDEEAATEAMIDTMSKKCPGTNCGWRIQKTDGCDHSKSHRLEVDLTKADEYSDLQEV